MARGGRRQGAGRKPNKIRAEEAENSPPKHPEPKPYDPVICEQARKLSGLGATDVEIADFFSVSVATIYRWKNEFSEFRDATKIGKEACDDRVERSLYHRAVGYTYDAVKIMSVGGKVVVTPYREHVPPDVAAANKWLCNRRPEKWRDKQEHEHSGPGGGPIQTEKTVIILPSNGRE